MSSTLTSRFVRGGLFVLGLLPILALLPYAAMAQTPSTTQGVPTESFLGEQFCFQTTFSNSGAPGYGPYLRLDLAPGLTFDSAQVFGAGAVIDVGTFPAAPGNQLTDPLIDQPVTGTEGHSLRILEFPVGSVVAGGPPLPVEICLTIDPSAVVGTPLPVTLTPVYEFGDTPTGDNGPIVGSQVVGPVTPTVLTFDKTDSAPESERPPGPSWPYDYTLTVDIANTATIQPLVIRDQLPADFQFIGTVNVIGGSGCSVTGTPSLASPGGSLEVTCTGATVGTPSGSDVEVTYSGYITDVLNETACDIQPQINDASVQASYQPASGPAQPLPTASSDTTVSAEHVVVQKAASPGQGVPGDAVTYTLAFQVTDFGDASSLVVTDVIPDGIDFVAHGGLTVNGSPVAVTPSVTVNPDFTTTVIYDIGAAAGTLSAGTAISVTYNAQLRQDFQNTGEPVLSSDALPNTVDAEYSLVQGASSCNNSSGASVGIIPVGLTKEIINPQPFYVPGEVVQFRLTKQVPAGDTSAIRFEDYLPLPVFDVTDVDLTFGNDIVYGPADTAGLTPTSITINAAQNALFIDWPDLTSTNAEVIQVDLFVTVTDDPFADGLFLTNILLARSENTPGAVAVSTGPVSFNVGAPVLVVTKGVAATDGNGTITPPPATEPVDGNLTGADAGDRVTYRITAENVGSAQAFDVEITDPGAPELTGCALASVTDGTGAPLAFTGSLAAGLVLTDPLAANDGTPGAPYADDAALVTVDCDVVGTVGPETTITNTASVTWASQGGATNFPTVTDDAEVITAPAEARKFFVTSSEPGTSDGAVPPRATIGEIVRYRLAARLPEGEIIALDLRDLLPTGLRFVDDGTARAAFVSNGGGLSASAFPVVNVSGASNDPGSIPSAAVATVIPPGSLSGGPFANGTDPIFSFGDVLNSDDDLDDEFLLVEFNALVLNNTGNQQGVTRNNAFQIRSGGSPIAPNSPNVAIRIAEPAIALGKSASPATGDAGDLISFTIDVANGTGGNVSPAHELRLTDTLPAGLAGVTGLTVTPTACPGLVTADATVGDSIDLTFSVLQPGCSVQVTFDATLTTGVAPGTSVTNVADAVWTSLPGLGTGPNPTGSTVPGGTGAPDGERNGSGGVNDYSASDPAPVSIPGVGIVKSVIATSETETGDSQFRPGIEDLVIGEQATFQIVATLPEGTTPQVVISDTLPFTNGVMRIDSASVVDQGASLTPDTSFPAATITDAQLSDGIDDTASFDFGQVVNSPDGVVDAGDRIVIEVNATLVDVAANANGDPLTNTALVQFGPGLNASANAGVDVVEPILTVEKTGSISSGDAGDSVLYTVTIQHTGGSAADAQDVVLQDVLPADLTLNVGSISQTSGTPVFVSNTSAGNTVALGWTDIPLGEVIVIEYAATLDPTVSPGELLTNTADVSWTSTAGPNPDERTNDDNDDHQILVTEPGLVKQVFNTSEPSTGDGEFGAPDDLTIGEEVTYRFTIQFPEGTSESAVVTDQLPIGSSVLELVSSRVVSIGANLSGAGLPAVNAPGTPSDTDADTVNDRATWILGDVLNAADGVNDAADEMVFEVVAVVLDVAANQSGDVDQLNEASLSTSSSTVSGVAPIDLVAPVVQLTKAVTDPADGFVDAGDPVTARITVSHTAASTADAFNLAITDTLPTGMSWGGDATVVSDCSGLSTDSSGDPVIAFDVPVLDQATATCFIEYQFTVDATVAPGDSLINLAELIYDSQPVFVAGRTRQGGDSDTAEVTVIAPTLVKVAVDTSQPDTGLSQNDPALLDLTIGETVTYDLTLVFPEGVTGSAELVDFLPATAGGVLEAIGATVTSVGANISTTLPGTPVFEDNQLADGLDDTVRFEFGDVTNTPDGIDSAADRIVVEIVARVADVAPNVDGTLLTNRGVFSFVGDSLEDTADVEVVEPIVALEKSMTLETDGVVRISLSLSNTGTAPAYDLEVTDVFDDADWNLAGFSPVSTPAGFELVLSPDTPAPGQQTLTFRTDVGAVSPDGTIPVGSSVSAVFDIPLAVLPPAPNPLPNTADLVGGDTLPGPDPAARVLPPDTDTATVAVPDLLLSKDDALLIDADSSGDVSPGDTLRYTLVLTNNGAAPATNVVIDDTPDPNSSLVVGSVTAGAGSVTVGNTAGDAVVQVSIASIAAGGSVTITYDTVIDDPLANGVTEVVNQAVFDSDQLPPGSSDDPDPPGTDDPTVVPVNAQPDLTLIKDDGGVSTTPGGTVVFTLDYANVGNQSAIDATITDTVPVGTTFDPGSSTPGWSCLPDTTAGSVCSLSLGTVLAGTSGSALFAVVVDSPAPPGLEEIVNAAFIGDDGSNGADPTPDNNSDGDTTPLVAAPDLTLVKDDGGATGVPNGVVVYTLDFQNVGNQDATGVVITDTVPANTSFEAGSSSAGWVCTPDGSAGSSCSLALGTVPSGSGGSAAFAVRIDDPLPIAVNQIDNAASITDDGSNGPDPTPGDNGDSDTTPVDNNPALVVDKALTSAPNPIEVGSVLVYTITVTNTGNATLTNVTIIDDLITPTGGTAPCASLAPGAVCTLIGEYVVTQPDIDTGSVVNNATGDSDQTPPGTDQVVVPINQNPLLDLVKTASVNDPNGNGQVDVGEVIDYTLTAANIGNVTLTNVTITDTLLPTLVCTPIQPATLAPTEALVCTGSYTVTQADVDTGEVINDATADSDQTPPITTQVTVPIQQDPAIDLVKEAVLDDTNGNGLGDAGEIVDYTLTATNIGNVTLIDVEIVDNLIDTLVCTPAQPTSLAPGEGLVCTGSIEITPVLLRQAVLQNVASAGGTGPGGGAVDDGDSTVTLLNSPVAIPTMQRAGVVALVLLLLLVGLVVSRERSVASGRNS